MKNYARWLMVGIVVGWVAGCGGESAPRQKSPSASEEFEPGELAVKLDELAGRP